MLPLRWLRLALFALLVTSAALADDGGVRHVATPGTDAGSSSVDGGVTPLPASGHPPPQAVEGVDAGPPRKSFPQLPGGGSHCKMVRTSDNLVLAERNSAGSLMDCEREVRAEALKSKECKQPHQRIPVTFTGDFNGIAIQPIEMHVNCPKK